MIFEAFSYVISVWIDFWFDFPLFLVDFVIGISWIVMNCGGDDWVMVGQCQVYVQQTWDKHKQRREREKERNY